MGFGGPTGGFGGHSVVLMGFGGHIGEFGGPKGALVTMMMSLQGLMAITVFL